jgi:hypothetical protein
MSCDFPEHHGRGGGFDWWLVLLAAVVAAVLAGLYLVWTALGSPVAVASVVAGAVWLAVGTCLVRAVVGSVRATSGRRGGELPVDGGLRKPLLVTVAPSAPAPAVDELAARRARRVA